MKMTKPTLTKAERDMIDAAKFYGPKLARSKDMSDAEWRRMQVCRQNETALIKVIERLIGEEI